jgi:flavin-dependent dehydrogenase
VHAVRLVSARGRDFQLELTPKQPGAQFLVAPRIEFDELVRRHAVACGARFENARVRSPLFDGTRVAGVIAKTADGERELRARVVIGADGATSTVARSLPRAKAPESERGVAIRGYLDGIRTLAGTVEFHFLKSLAPGYGWIFPLGPRRANVGVIVRTDRFKRRGVALEALLHEFLDSPDVRSRMETGASTERIASWQVPYGTPRAGARAFDGALLVGDAGRFVDSMTGEGIHHAVVTAALAARVADEALSTPSRSADILATFDARCDREIGHLIRRSFRAQKYVAAHSALLEALFLAARARRANVVSWLNAVSTDYVTR